MELIKLSQQTDDRTLNIVLVGEYDLIGMNTIEYIWGVYLKLKIRLTIITPNFIITSITFYTTNNLGCMTPGGNLMRGGLEDLVNDEV